MLDFANRERNLVGVRMVHRPDGGTRDIALHGPDLPALSETTGLGHPLFSYEGALVGQDDDGISVVADGLVVNGGTIQSADDTTDVILTHASSLTPITRWTPRFR